MRVGRVMAVVLAGASLVLLAWVVVLAQQPRFVPNPAVRLSSADTWDPYGRSTPMPPPPTRFAAESSSNAYRPDPTSAPPEADLSLLAVKAELRKGLALDGQIAVTGPLVCGTAFGEAAIPLTAIRGIRLHDVQVAAGPERPLPQATIILTNNDSLTVSLTAAQIQVKTEWGEANIQVSHLKSLLLTMDDVQWQEANGRWALVAVEKPAEENPAEEKSLLPAFEDGGLNIPAPLLPPPESSDSPPRLGSPSETDAAPADARPALPDLPKTLNPSES